MTTEHTITIKALGGNLTIADLRAFLDQFDKDTGEGGVYPGFRDALRPMARVSFGGLTGTVRCGIKSITVTVPE
jgi:hypothetical protein